MTIKKLTGLYPGTFDPVTLGHLDIIKRAVKLVDHLVIGVATNASKSPIFTLDERVAMVRSEAERLAAGQATIDVVPFDTLLVKFAAQVGASVVFGRCRTLNMNFRWWR
jgi:pantetheine-phosphate adenylyltransferase